MSQSGTEVILSMSLSLFVLGCAHDKVAEKPTSQVKRHRMVVLTDTVKPSEGREPSASEEVSKKITYPLELKVTDPSLEYDVEKMKNQACTSLVFDDQGGRNLSFHVRTALKDKKIEEAIASDEWTWFPPLNDLQRKINDQSHPKNPVTTRNFSYSKKEGILTYQKPMEDRQVLRMKAEVSPSLEEIGKVEWEVVKLDEKGRDLSLQLRMVCHPLVSFALNN